MKKIITFIILCTLMGLTGCANRVTGFTFVSTKNFNPNTEFASIGKVAGSDSKNIIMVIPTGNPKLEEAIDNAIESAPGCCALSDVKVYRIFFYIPFIYGKYGWAVEGTAMKERIPVVTDSVGIF